MPYYRCRSCGLSSYSATRHLAAPECPAPTCTGQVVVYSNGTLPPPLTLERTFPARPGSVVEARRSLLALALPDATHEHLQLLISELVSNSVLHGGSSAYDPETLDDPIDVRVAQVEDELRVSVHDRGPGFTKPARVAGRSEGGGLGLVLVEALSRAWGVDHDPDGCTVWCTLEAGAAA